LSIEESRGAPDKTPHRVNAIALPWWKRSFDFVIAGSLLLLASPVIVLIGAVSRIMLGNPVLYRQERGGLGGSTFEIVKFRTMTNATDADGNLLPDDQRRHGWGNFLRRTSLDELPTLLNIVRGEMSVVGPRPLMATYLDRYSARESQRHRVTPGLTGMAQTQGRNLLDWSDRFELDLEYIEQRSMRTDLRILRDTVSIVLSREGADGNDHCTEFQGLTVVEARQAS
jgi:lipopolysaccharide/colanic/teichoic acid biosynthesis glycosyltransferase